MKFLYLTWTIICLILIGLIATFLLHPVDEDWLMDNAWFLKSVDQYSQISPVIKHWQTVPPATTNINRFWELASKKPYVYLPKKALQEFSNRFTPSGLKSYLQRAKTILVTPCSFEKKRQILVDPLMVSQKLNDIITPAFTTACPVIYICIYGPTKEECILNAEAVSRKLDQLQAQNLIGSYQSATDFFVSPDQQRARLLYFTSNIDSHQWDAKFEKELEFFDINPKLFAKFTENIKNMITADDNQLSISTQQERIADLGLADLSLAFLNKDGPVYRAVCRVLPKSSKSIFVEQKIITDALEPINCSVGSAETLVKSYHSFGLGLLICILLIWCCGIFLVLSIKSIKQFIETIIFGSKFKARVKFFNVENSYKDYLEKVGFKKFDDYIDYENKLPQFAKNAETMRVHKSVSSRPTRQIEALKLPRNEALPTLWQDSENCVVYIKRAYGSKVSEIRNEYVNLCAMTKAGIAVSPVIAYGEAVWQSEKCAFLVVEDLKGYLPLDRWQAVTVPKLSTLELQETKEKLIVEMANIVKKCHQNNFFNVQLYAKHIFFKKLPDGNLTVSLIDIEKVYQRSGFSQFVGKLFPFFALKAATTDLTLMNRHLFFNIWNFKDRLSIFKIYLNAKKLNRREKKTIKKIAKVSIKKGYCQFRTKKNKLYLNMANLADMLPFDDWKFKQFMKIDQGRQITKKRDRTVFAFEKAGTTYYLKRHYGLKLKESLKLLWENKGVVSNAWLEWSAMEKAEALGIPTVPVVSMGQKISGFREKQSFLLTSELPAGKSVEQLLSEGLELTPSKRIELAQRIGLLARKFHSAGLVHRDFYLGHIYVVGDLNDSYKLHLLDLQRVKKGAAIYNRWSVKDISALYFSTKAIASITDKDRLRFLKAYLSLHRLDRLAKIFLSKLVAKCQKIEKHTEKLLVRRRAAGELPPNNA